MPFVANVAQIESKSDGAILRVGLELETMNLYCNQPVWLWTF